MGFLNPFLLFGLTAVSVPIIIHLLNRRRFQKVVWAAMRFLKISVEQNQRRMRIEDMILLALRCLLLALLALALARPAFKTSGTDVFGQSKVTAVIVLDNSQSMALSDGTLTRFDKARKAAEQALDTMTGGSATAVILASDIANAVIPEPTFDLNLARKVLREATITDRATDLAPSLSRAVDILRGRLAIRKEIYVFTDGQATGWRQLEEIRKALARVKTEIRSHIVLVGEHEQHNLGISELRIASELTPIRQPLRFEVRVANYGQEEARDVRVTLSVDGEPASAEFAVPVIGAGESKSVSLFTRLRTEGYHSITARIPPDRQPADDYRTVVVRALKEVRVLLVDGEPSAEARESETFFLGNALVPVSADDAPNFFIKPNRITLPELSGARLDDYDAVVLANVPEFGEPTANNLAAYLRRGGGVIIFPGARVNTGFYNDVLARKFNFLPATLGTPRGQAEQEEKFFTLQRENYEHPIVSIWNDPGSGTLASARFFRAFDLKPVPYDAEQVKKADEEKAAPSPEAKPRPPTQEAGEPRVIIKYADGGIAAMERNWGLGRVILFSSTADTAWNDLPVRPAFVPLVHRALGSIVIHQDEGLNIRVGAKFARRVGVELLGKDVLVFKPRQTDAVRDLRRIEMTGGWPTFQYDKTDLAGTYDLSVVDPAVKLKFAASADPIESTLDELSPEQRKLLETVAHVVEWGPKFSLRETVERQRTGLEFWLPILLLALLVAVVETFLAQYFSRSK